MEPSSFSGLLKRLAHTLQCSLCRRPPSAPCTLMECGHTFCQGCLMRQLGSAASCPECGIVVLIKNSRRNPGYSTMLACVRKMQKLLEVQGLEAGLGRSTTTGAIVAREPSKSTGSIEKKTLVHALSPQPEVVVSPRSRRRMASQTKTPVSAIKGLALNSPPVPLESAVTPTIRARPRRTIVNEFLADAVLPTPPKKRRPNSQSQSRGRKIVSEECGPSLLTILTSGLSPDQRMIIESSYRQLPRARVSLVTIEGRNLTHLITNTNAVGLAPRTAKYLRGVLRGLAIVSYDWYLASLAEGPVPVESYLIRGDDVVGLPTDAVARSIDAHRRGDPPLFASYSFFISSIQGSRGTGPTRHELANLIEAGGGKVLSRRPSGGQGRRIGAASSKKDQLIILCDANEPVAESDHDGLQYHPYSWLFDCISHYRIL